MILTGKAKEDFLKWCKQDANWMQTYEDIFLHALIIEWFDSIGIIITISEDSFNYVDEEETKDYWYSVFSYFIKKYSDIEDGLNNYEEYYDTEEFSNRQESTKKAIIKANEIYNERDTI